MAAGDCRGHAARAGGAYAEIPELIVAPAIGGLIGREPTCMVVANGQQRKRQPARDSDRTIRSIDSAVAEPSASTSRAPAVAAAGRSHGATDQTAAA